MDLCKLIIEFFLTHGAVPLVLLALSMLLYVVYHISNLSNIHEYKPWNHVVAWLLIAIPQITGIFIAEEYKESLPIHSIELTTGGCTLLRQKVVIKDQKCFLNGRIFEDKTNTYLIKANEHEISVNKCDILLIRTREFSEYKREFEQSYENTSLYEVMF